MATLTDSILDTDRILLSSLRRSYRFHLSSRSGRISSIHARDSKNSQTTWVERNSVVLFGSPAHCGNHTIYRPSVLHCSSSIFHFGFRYRDIGHCILHLGEQSSLCQRRARHDAWILFSWSSAWSDTCSHHHSTGTCLVHVLSRLRKFSIFQFHKRR